MGSPLALAAFLGVLAFAACAHRVDTKAQDQAVDLKRIVVSPLRYDTAGRPTALQPLKHRPSSNGARFSIAHQERGRLVSSYDVTVVDSADLQRPLNAVYDWTSRGLEWGWSTSEGMAQELLSPVSSPGPLSSGNGRAAAIIAVAFVVSPAVLGATGGAMVGLADGMKTSAEELVKLLRGPRERLISYTRYTYDARDRLVSARLYSGDLGKELARTEFQYLGDADVPNRTEILNLQDGTSKLWE